MDAYSKLLLELYRAGREMPGNEFADFALGIVKSVIPFDSARLLTIEKVGKGAIVHGSHLHNEPDAMVLDWEEISRHDTVLDTVISRPGRAFSYHAPHLYAGAEKGAVRDYARQYGHQNGLVVSQFDSERGFWQGLSLYRARTEDRYLEQGHPERLIECLMPHMVEALTVNQILSAGAIEHARQAPNRATAAITRADGTVDHCGPGFTKLMRLEWPEWRGRKLPDVLLTALGRIKAAGFTGACITVSVEHIGNLLVLQARRIAPLSRLSPREREVARSYGEGKSYKEIARAMDLSPATVRNFLQRIYQKLQISDKAELAAMLVRSEMD